MKIFLPLSLLLFSCLGFSQKPKKPIYFPQEQLIHPECRDAEDKNHCLREKISTALSLFIYKAVGERKITEDTLNVRVVFEVDKNGRVKNGRDFTFINDSILRIDYENDLRKITKKLPQFEVINRKSKPYISNHKLSYSFIINKSKDSIKPIPTEQNMYIGGVIEEVPQFPGCKRGDSAKARSCFQKMMQKHISKNFAYPQTAQAKGLQGRVNIMFQINKDGNLANIKVLGPHPILEEEAIRIVKLLPKFGPGLQNGIPVRIPYSIPITFKLQ